jgi:hypothetical protein
MTETAVSRYTKDYSKIELIFGNLAIIFWIGLGAFSFVLFFPLGADLLCSKQNCLAFRNSILSWLLCPLCAMLETAHFPVWLRQSKNANMPDLSLLLF